MVFATSYPRIHTLQGSAFEVAGYSAVTPRDLSHRVSALKWYYDENRILPIEATLKHKQVVCQRRKLLSTLLNISFRSRDIQVFKICKLAKWWRHILNQISIKYDEKRYLSQFVTEMFEFLQQGSTKGAAQYELKIFVTMAT